MITAITEPPRREPGQYLEALDYKAPFLIDKLLKEQITETAEQAEALFAEVVKYLILGRTYPDKPWEMISRRVDEVWHQFVLFTAEYCEFGRRYFGHYIHHAPGNTPGLANRLSGKVPPLAEFSAHYTGLFGTPLPAIWFDTRSVALDRRMVLSYTAGGLRLVTHDDMITVAGVRGPLVAVNDIARAALEFMLRTRSFYVRELPGELTDDEKLGLAETLLAHHVLMVGS